MKTGLNRMSRNHIRNYKTIDNCIIDMAIGMPGKNGVISGMRASCEVVIEINMPKAILAGKIPFFISENQVILSPGLQDGSIPPEYFRSVIDIKKRELLYSAPFDYICVYDFECQCEEGSKNLNFNVSNAIVDLFIGNN